MRRQTVQRTFCSLCNSHSKSIWNIFISPPPTHSGCKVCEQWNATCTWLRTVDSHYKSHSFHINSHFSVLLFHLRLQYVSPTHWVLLAPMTHTSSWPISLCLAGHCREMTVPTLVPLPLMIVWVPRAGRGMGVHWRWERPERKIWRSFCDHMHMPPCHETATLLLWSDFTDRLQVDEGLTCSKVRYLYFPLG